MGQTRDFVKVDSAARTSPQKQETQNSDTLLALEEFIRGETMGKREDSAYGGNIPVLLFFVSELGFGTRNRNPIVMHPKIASVGPRPHEKVLEFRGVPARGLGALIYPGKDFQEQEFKSQVELMTSFYMRQNMKITSGDAEEGERQATHDFKFFKDILATGPILAMCSVGHGDNYGMIDSMEKLQGNDERQLRISRAKDTAIHSKFATVTGLAPTAGKVTVSQNVKTLGLLGLDEIPTVAPTPAVVSKAPPPPPVETEDEKWDKITTDHHGFALGNPGKIDIVTREDRYGDTHTFGRHTYDLVIKTQDVWEIRRKYILDNQKVDIGPLKIKPGEAFRVGLARIPKSKRSDLNRDRKFISSSLKDEKLKEMLKNMKRDPALGPEGYGHTAGEAYDFYVPNQYVRSPYRAAWVDLAADCMKIGGFKRIGISLTANMGSASNPQPNPTLHIDLSRNNELPFYVYFNKKSKKQMESAKALKTQKERNKAAQKVYKDAITEAASKNIISPKWWSIVRKAYRMMAPEMTDREWKNAKYGK